MFSTAAAARRFELHAARGLASHAKDRKADLQRHVNDMARALTGLLEIGGDRNRIHDMAATLHDTATNIDADCLRLIDEAGDYAEPVELGELDWIIRRE